MSPGLWRLDAAAARRKVGAEEPREPGARRSEASMGGGGAVASGMCGTLVTYGAPVTRGARARRGARPGRETPTKYGAPTLEPQVANAERPKSATGTTGRPRRTPVTRAPGTRDNREHAQNRVPRARTAAMGSLTRPPVHGQETTEQHERSYRFERRRELLAKSSGADASEAARNDAGAGIRCEQAAGTEENRAYLAIPGATITEAPTSTPRRPPAHGRPLPPLKPKHPPRTTFRWQSGNAASDWMAKPSVATSVGQTARHFAMTVDGIRLTFRADDDGTGELTAEVQSDGFRGRGAAWFGKVQLHEFATNLRSYPLPAELRLSLVGGFWSQAVPTNLEQTHLAIEAYPVGHRGQIGLRVKANGQLWERDRPESQNQATVEILSTYARLERFARDIDRLVSGETPEAVLEVEIFT